jgi:hypothetical protein
MDKRTKRYIVLFMLLSATISLIAGIVVGRVQMGTKPVCHSLAEDSSVTDCSGGDYHNGAWYVK